MAVATVLALNVSAATSGFALLGRVVLAVVVGLVSYVAAAVATRGPPDPAHPPPDGRSGRRPGS